MEIRRLRYFARIAEDGSLTKAAGVLRIAQPALSRQMRLLEQELGVTLFSRTARGMRLTEAGEYLHASAAGPLRALDLALQNVRSFSTGIQGNFTIGMPSSVGDIAARTLALRMSARFPDIRLRIVEGPTGSLIDWLNRGMIDFALLEEASRDDRLADVELITDTLMLVGPAGSGLSPDRPMPFVEAAQHPLIIPSHHLGIRGAINDAAAKSRTTLKVHLEVDSCRLIKELVEAGNGYTLLPALFVRQEYLDSRLAFCPVDAPALAFRILMSSRHKDQGYNDRLEGAVMETVQEIFLDLARDDRDLSRE